MIITASDEAFYTLFSSGDSLPYQVPVVFFGIKYPDKELIASLPNVCGFTANPDFYVILKQAQKVFPQRKEVICVIDNSFLSNKGREDFKQEWQLFQEENPDYKMKLYNTQHESTNHIIAAICYPRNSYARVVVAPKWSPFLSFVGKNSKAPVFSSQNVGLMNGVFAAYDADAYTSAMSAAKKASRVLKGESPLKLGVTETEQGFIYDYKQLDFFHIDPDKVSSSGSVVNQPYWERYKLLFILLYPSILALLIVSIVWLLSLIHILLKETKLLSSISIIGTALAIAMIMVIVITLRATIAPFAPESYRDRMLIFRYAGFQYKTNENWQSNGPVSYKTAKACFKEMAAPEAVTITSSFSETMLAAKPCLLYTSICSMPYSCQ